jgi:hypothetical protein
MTFLDALAEQRWDDHRYYHHNRINQALHLVSAVTFICAYVLIFIEPVWAVMLGWLIAMPSRQIGHFFFEPHEYDQVNQATHEHKEEIKVGYNLFRKVVLHTIWALAPVVLYFAPTLGGLLPPVDGWYGFLNNLAITWLVLGGGAIVFRSIQLFFLKNVQAGLVWPTKILTDPFHDVKLYHKAPMQVLRGELFDPAESHAGAEAR